MFGTVGIALHGSQFWFSDIAAPPGFLVPRRIDSLQQRGTPHNVALSRVHVFQAVERNRFSVLVADFGSRVSVPSWVTGVFEIRGTS